MLGLKCYFALDMLRVIKDNKMANPAIIIVGEVVSYLEKYKFPSNIEQKKVLDFTQDKS